CTYHTCSDAQTNNGNSPMCQPSMPCSPSFDYPPQSYYTDCSGDQSDTFTNQCSSFDGDSCACGYPHLSLYQNTLTSLNVLYDTPRLYGNLLAWLNLLGYPYWMSGG